MQQNRSHGKFKEVKKDAFKLLKVQHELEENERCRFDPVGSDKSANDSAEPGDDGEQDNGSNRADEAAGAAIEPDLPVVHPAIDRRRREVENIPLDLEERKVDPREEAKEQLHENEIEREDAIDELDEEEIDRLLQTAHDSSEWQPDERARVEQSHRFVVVRNRN